MYYKELQIFKDIF